MCSIIARVHEYIISRRKMCSIIARVHEYIISRRKMCSIIARVHEYIISRGKMCSIIARVHEYISRGKRSFNKSPVKGSEKSEGRNIFGHMRKYDRPYDIYAINTFESVHQIIHFFFEVV